MGKLKQVFVFVGLLSCAAGCFARQISFQVVQHNGRETEVAEASYVVEDCVLNEFFDRGFIITNSDAAVSDSARQDEKLWQTGFSEAAAGASDYFVQLRLYFVTQQNDSRTKSETVLEHVDWEIASVKSGEKIKASTVKAGKKIVKKDDLGSLSKSLVTEITNALKA